VTDSGSSGGTALAVCGGMCRFFVIVVTLGLLAPAVASAGPTSGLLSGSVTAAGTGAPIAGANVQLYDANSQRTSFRLTTDAAGQFSIALSFGGRVLLVVSATGYATQLLNGIPCVAEDCRPFAGHVIVVPNGGVATVNVVMQPEGRISGAVRRADGGDRLAGVEISLYNFATSLVGRFVTAADGAFSFGSLPAGSYFAVARVPAPVTGGLDVISERYGGQECTLNCRIDLGTPIVVAAGATFVADFNLDRGGTISGRVVAQGSGIPIAATVAAFAGGLQYGTTATTDGAGNYTLTGLPTGSYTLRASNAANFADAAFPGAVAVAPGATQSGIDFALAAGGSIAGTLALASLPAGGSFSVPAIHVYDMSDRLARTISPILASDGTYTWTASGLPAGTYFVRTFGDSSSPFVDESFDGRVCVAADCLPSSGTPITVAAGTRTDIAVTLAAGASISGTVNRVGSVAAESLVHRQISVYDSRGVVVPGRVSAPADSTTYIVSGLPPGTYYVKLNRDSRGEYFDSFYRGIDCSTCPVTMATPVTVGVSEVKTGIDLLARNDIAAWIEGTVRDAAAQPLSTISVEAYAPTGTLVASTVTTADGWYRLSGVGYGSSFLRTVNNRGFVDERHDGEPCANCDPIAGAAVVISTGPRVGIDFSLSAGHAVSGSVTSSSGAPLPAARVAILRPDGTSIGEPAADPFGRYIAIVPPGSYRVRSQPLAGYIQELFDDLPCPFGTCDATAGTPVATDTPAAASVNFSLGTCAAGAISPVSLAAPVVGVPYRQVLRGLGSGSRVTVLYGILPAGLTLDSVTGVISGTPTAAGRYAFVAAIADGAACVATRSFTLEVQDCVLSVGGTTVFSAGGGTAVLSVTTSCAWWEANSHTPWLTVTDLSRIDPLTVTVQAQPNLSNTPRTGTVVIGPRVVSVSQAGTMPTSPFGVIDAPADGAVVSGSVGITGWALDQLAVSRVLIFRDPVTPEPATAPVFIGVASIVPGARPDVEAAFPEYPHGGRAGWGYLLLTNMLPAQGNGTFRISAYAENATGSLTLLGARTIVANNAAATLPFGAIDTPAQGGAVSGTAFLNAGWALTPQPNTVAFDGSSIGVFIDGVPIGPLTTYNLFRSDVSSLFPGLANSAGPVGARAIDTTALSEGVHTIAWLVEDSGGGATGVGSRYFTVQNAAWSPALRVRARPAVPDRVPGSDIQRHAASLEVLPFEAAVDQPLHVDPLDRVEISLPAATCTRGFDGYLVVNGELRDLPVGAALEPQGRFYWHPGPAFRGLYSLVFVRTACDGSRTRLPVSLTIGGDPSVPRDGR